MREFGLRIIVSVIDFSYDLQLIHTHFAKVLMMDYKLVWLVENHVILLQLAGAYSEAVLREQMEALNVYAEQGTAPIYVIVDTTGATTLPKNFREPLSIVSANQMNSKVVWVIIVTSNPFFRFLGSIAGKFTGVHFRPVASLEESIEVLARINPTMEGLREVDLTPYRTASTPS